tara:strand:+ start:8495 stop:9337 length:843 start_codon:yes stop_codon:yes gene_type:complete
MKHNKKRNPAFLYEALIREMAVAVSKGESDKQLEIKNILVTHFKQGTELRKELDIYRTLYRESFKAIPYTTARRLIDEVKKEHKKLDNKVLFTEQTALINNINKALGSSIFSNFVPNYKYLASIAQIFQNGSGKSAMSTKAKVILEEQVAGFLSAKPQVEKAMSMEPIGKLAYKTFVTKFNSEYGGSLLEEQRTLINMCVFTFTSNDTAKAKLYFNEEVGRLREAIERGLEEFKVDDGVQKSFNAVLDKLNELSTRELKRKDLVLVMKTQALVSELENDD